MRREFGDLQNLPQDLRSFGRFCGPQTVFAWDLDNIMEPTKKDFRAVGNRTQQILTRANGESTVRPFDSEETVGQGRAPRGAVVTTFSSLYLDPATTTLI